LTLHTNFITLKEEYLSSPFISMKMNAPIHNILRLIVFLFIFFLLPAFLILSQKQQVIEQKAAENDSIPGKPENLSASCVNATQVMLSWDAGANTSHYTASLSDGRTTDLDRTSYTFDVTTGTQYTWSLIAKNSSSESSQVLGPTFTCNVSAALVTKGSIAIPTNLHAACDNTTKQVTLSWDASPNADAYDIHYVKSGEPDSQIDKRISGGTSYVFSPSQAQSYDWWMEAVNADSSANASGSTFRCPFSNSETPPSISPSIGGPSTGDIYIQFIDESNAPLDVKSGTIFVKREDGGNSKGFNITTQLNTTSPPCFSKVGPGKYKCTGRDSTLRWYGGLADDQIPPGYIITDWGTRQEDGEIPLVLPARDSVTITVKLRLNSSTGSLHVGNNPAFVPNCTSIQGPTTIKLGQSAQYSAKFTSAQGSSLFGIINAMKTTNSTPTNADSWDWKTWPPSVIGTADTLTFTWTPTSPGIYQVFCRAWNGNNECRGAVNTVPANDPQKYYCDGPGSVMTVNVTSATFDTNAPATNMCQFATTIGGNVVSPETPVTVSAISKPSFGIKTYTFSFHNLDNLYPTPTLPFDKSPKPISFVKNNNYVVDSPNNTITITHEDLNKIDINTGKKPTNIQINAYFTDTAGQVSILEPNCVAYVTVNTLQTSPLPTVPQAFAPSTEPAGANYIATFGVLLIAVVVSLNFFFH
jgi:hypothetical protein